MFKEFFRMKPAILFPIFLLILLNLFNPHDVLSGNTRHIKLYEKYIQSGARLRAEGKFALAIREYEKAFKISRRIGDENRQVESLIFLGILYWNEGEIDKSYELHRKALVIAEKLDRKDKKQECLDYIQIYNLYKAGKEYRTEGFFEKSIECFSEAIALAKRMRSKEYELKCLRQLGVTYIELSDNPNLFSTNKEALEIARELNHRKEEGTCLNNIGIYYHNLGIYSRSLKLYEEALKIAQYVKNIKDQSMCITNIANIYSYIGNQKKALEYMSKALKIDKKIKDYSYISMDLSNIGEILLRVGRLSKRREEFDSALEYFKKSLKLSKKVKDKKNEVIVLNNIGFLYLELKDYQKALRFLEEGLRNARKIKNLEFVSMILTNIAAVYSAQELYSLSIDYYKRAIALALRIRARYILWEAYFGLGKCYEKKEEFSLALTHYKEAISFIDQMRNQIFMVTDKTGFSRDKLIVYESLLNLLFELHRKEPYKRFDEEIFHIVESIKARAFFESLGESSIDLRENLTPELKAREKDISLQISQLIYNLRKSNISENRMNELFSKLEEKEDEYLRLMSSVKNEAKQFSPLIASEPIRLRELQNQYLNEKTAFVEYFLGEKRSFLLFITRSNFDLYVLPSRERLEESVKAYLKMLSAPENGKFQGIEASKRLFRELLFPLNNRIEESIENLVVIPDGTLYYLPFETLITENKYLISKFKISYAPSSSSLAILSARRNKDNSPKNLLAFGNPVYTLKESKTGEVKAEVAILREMYLSQGFNFSPLPYSEKEILEISNLFPKVKSDIYLGDNAREDAFKNSNLDDYKIIHFACHGFLDENSPFRSALVLTLGNDSEEDGFLQAREIYTLRLSADLIVLSACQTGRGKLERGEGIMGLPSVFFYSGASSVVTSLWKISDKSTSELMRYFYQFLSQGEDKAQALRLAKLRMIDSQYSNPYYWAAFVLNGEYRSSLNFQ